jgi:hypothetical protein
LLPRALVLVDRAVAIAAVEASVVAEAEPVLSRGFGFVTGAAVPIARIFVAGSIGRSVGRAVGGSVCGAIGRTV